MICIVSSENSCECKLCNHEWKKRRKGDKSMEAPIWKQNVCGSKTQSRDSTNLIQMDIGICVSCLDPLKASQCCCFFSPTCPPRKLLFLLFVFSSEKPYSVSEKRLNSFLEKKGFFFFGSIANSIDRVKERLTPRTCYKYGPGKVRSGQRCDKLKDGKWKISVGVKRYTNCYSFKVLCFYVYSSIDP